MAALTVEVCLRKKGKVSRPSELEMILLGYYRVWPKKLGAMRLFWNERLQHDEQMNRNFGIKSFLSQNWGACVDTEFWFKMGRPRGQYLLRKG